ncbi:hypothetical protein AC578_4063 [Pseudocercospora eumusae]|uniref:Thioredoxin domain-containing protein n=1 Tax=Pseudocercospora eumusae TaxID=321146 RepID=A0A139HDN6_9PEZI|nr:hypothetical protein AC578_4063 [Pseudocercospora eumusae]
MSTASSAFFKRTLLTTARFNRPNSTFRPVFQNSRPFSVTSATMGQGVHNLQNKAAFDEALAQKDTLLVLDCFATWCGPCKVIAPKVSAFADSYEKARFYKIDVDECPEVAQELSVRAMPTFFLFKNGEKVGEVVGANPAALETAIKQNL